jgi:hypothetical protein
MVSRFYQLTTVVALAAVLVMTGCKKNDDGSTSVGGVSISGTLSLGNSSSAFQKILLESKNGDSDIDALAVSDYSAVCATTSVPILSATSLVAADGTFNVNIGEAAGQPLSCYLVDSTGTKAADFLIENSANKDLNGNSEKSSTITPTSDISMDTVTFDAATGEVIVPSTAIASEITTTVSGSVFDPTGAWTISTVDFTLPTGVKSPCSAAEQAANTCNGPPDGQAIYLKLWTGSKSSDSSAVYGLQVWNSQSGYASCGSRIGLSNAQKALIGIDFSANGSADAEFSFPTSATFTDQVLNASSSPTLTDNWKMSTAKTMYSFNPNCGPVNLTIGSTTYSNAWRCGPDSSGDYQIGLNGGCTVNSTGKSAEVTNWSGMSCSSSTDSNGIKTNVCTGTATVNSASVAVTCKNAWAVVNSSNVVQPSGDFNWSEMTGGISANTNCSAISTASEASRMAQARCYADYYWRSGLSQYSGACMPRIDMDWSATTEANFIKKDFRPNQLVFFEQYKPFGDGSGGSMVTRQEHYQGVQLAGGDSWVNCEVIETGGLNIKKINDNKLLVTYQSSEVTSSTAKPACLAKFTGKRETFVFYMSK